MEFGCADCECGDCDAGLYVDEGWVPGNVSAFFLRMAIGCHIDVDLGLVCRQQVNVLSTFLLPLLLLPVLRKTVDTAAKPPRVIIVSSEGMSSLIYPCEQNSGLWDPS